MTSKEYPALTNSPLLNAAFARVASWVFPILIGAVLMQLIDASGNAARAAQQQREIDQLRVQLTTIEQSLAAGGPPALARRVDDLQIQVNNEFNKINTKLDNIQNILIKNSR